MVLTVLGDGGLAHDVFISYSSKDKPVADATCATLEAKGIRCWIAPRDIRPGSDWGEAIIDGINDARVFVLVFSNNANVSVQIKREVERAINKGLPVIPFRIENVMPVKSLEFFLSTPHWLDAFSPPLEQHLLYLASVIRSILDGKPAPAPLPPPSPPRLEQPWYKRRWVLGGGAALLALGAYDHYVLEKEPPGFAGNWTAGRIDIDPDTPSPFAIFSINNFFKAAVAGNKLNGSLSVSDIGAFHSVFGGEDSGTIVSMGGNRLRFNSDVAHRAMDFTATVMNTPPANIVASLGGQAGEGGILLDSPGLQQSMLVGTSRGPGLTGHWYTDTPAAGPIDAIKTALDVTPEGHYTYKFSFIESGTFQAANGQWTRTRQGAMPVTGTYKFDGSDRVTASGGGGTTLWVRAS